MANICFEKSNEKSKCSDDIFQLGVILFYIVFKRMPYKLMNKFDKHFKFLMSDLGQMFWESHSNAGLKVENVS